MHSSTRKAITTTEDPEGAELLALLSPPARGRPREAAPTPRPVAEAPQGPNDPTVLHPSDGMERGGKQPTHSARLVQLAVERGVELFHDDEDPYAAYPVEGHRETSRVSDRGFREWLSWQFYQRTGTVPGSQALQDALNVLAGRAKYLGAAR